MKKRLVFLVVPVIVLLLGLAMAPSVDATCDPTPTPTPTPPPCEGGCTPGYWKNWKKHGDEWLAAGVDPGADFDATFGVDYFDPDITLYEAVWTGGFLTPAQAGWSLWPIFLIPFAVLGTVLALRIWQAIPEAAKK